MAGDDTRGASREIEEAGIAILGDGGTLEEEVVVVVMVVLPLLVLVP